MTHLMARGGPPGRRSPRRDARASGPASIRGRNAPGGPPRATEGRVCLTARCVALRLRYIAPPREPRLTGGQANPVKWVIINAPWYETPSATRLSTM